MALGGGGGGVVSASGGTAIFSRSAKPDVIPSAEMLDVREISNRPHFRDGVGLRVRAAGDGRRVRASCGGRRVCKEGGRFLSPLSFFGVVAVRRSQVYTVL